jgi:hypothetical protein
MGAAGLVGVTVSRKRPSQEKQERDSAGCYAWAVTQTGFDPIGAEIPPHQRVRIFAQNPTTKSDDVAPAKLTARDAALLDPANWPTLVPLRIRETRV